MGHTSDRASGCRVSDEWTFRGMRMAVLENDELRVVVALDRGAEIVEFRDRAGTDPLLHLPGRLQPPDALAGAGTDGDTAFVDRYAGGWQEILPNGGPPSDHRGARFGQHGDLALLPWTAEVVEDGPDQVSLLCRGRSARVPLAIERRMTLRAGRASIVLDETLSNESAAPVDAMWGHHVAFGRPFLAGGARIDTSARHVTVHEAFDGPEARRLVPGSEGPWPYLTGPTGGPVDLRHVPPPGAERAMEMCYLSDFDGPAWYAISTDESGFGLRWDGDLFRFLWLWQELEAGQGYPWWGSVFAVALEPWTSFPTSGLAEAVRRGTQLVVHGGETISTQLVATAFRPGGHVTSIDADGNVTVAEGGPA